MTVFSRILELEKRKNGLPAALIVAPTRELALQIYEDAALLGSHTGLTLAQVVGGIDYRKQADVLKKGADIVRKVFKRAGARDDSIMELAPSGAHPSACCRIGEVVDTNLKTRLDNLYCCDASVVPESLGLPVVWTAVSLGKRLSRHLDQQLNN